MTYRLHEWTAGRRRGAVAIIAMLYLVLMSTLAVGFYAAVTASVQVSANDERIAQSQLAAESGMDFMRYHLARVSIPPTTPAANVLTELYKDLQSALDGTKNLGTHKVTMTANVITIPGDGSYIPLDSHGRGFRCTITDWLGEIVVKSEGYGGAGEIRRAITMDFTRRAHSSGIFDFAVASKGQIVMKKGSITTVTGVDPLLATMFSALNGNPAIQVLGGTIGGELTILDTATVEVTGGTVATSSVPKIILADHVNTVSDPPEFPTFDPTAYRSYATNAWVNKQKVQKNIYVKPNTNPTFNANDTVQGIIYIASPNQVLFNGDFKLQGFVVMEQGTSTTDSLTFKGNVTQSPLPSGTEFDTLRATSGVAILAPGAAVSMTGSTDSSVRGSIVVNTFSFAGSADLQIDQGTLMTLNPTAPKSANFAGKNVKFGSTGSKSVPTTGVSYSFFFYPNPGSYQEVGP